MYRVLIVDDSPVAALQLERSLDLSGYSDISTCETARHAFELLAQCHDPRLNPDDRSGRYDLILMDINMPDIDGIEATRIIKADPCLQDIPIILISASDEMSTLERGFEAGAIDYISKPVDLIELRARARAALRLKEEMDRRKARELELEELKNKFEMLSNLDGLTGIPNRRRFDVVFEHEWLRARREQEPLSLLMLDIDFFKKYNDSYGHVQGDTCLRAVAAAVKSALHRPADLAARYGGEEFALLLPNTEAQGAMAIAKQLKEGVAALQIEHYASEISPYVTVSIGGSCAVANTSMEARDLLDAADKALYDAKASGRNTIRIAPDHCKAADGYLCSV